MANKVAYWRRERELTQEVLSMAANMPRHRLGLIERQLVEATDAEIEILARILKVTPNKIRSGQGSANQIEFSLDEEGVLK